MNLAKPTSLEPIHCPECNETVWKSSAVLRFVEDIVLDTAGYSQRSYKTLDDTKEGSYIWKCGNGHEASLDLSNQLLELQGEVG